MKTNSRFEKYFDRFSFISTVIDVIFTGITLIDVFYFVAVAVEKICQRKRSTTKQGDKRT